jgi:hypothetical protein
MQDTLIDIRKDNKTYASLADTHLKDFVEQRAAESIYYSRALLPLTTDPDALWSSLRKPVQRQASTIMFQEN